MAICIDFMKAYDRESLAEELRRIAAVTGKKTVSIRDIKLYGRVSGATVTKKFGGMCAANQAAGLVPSTVRRWTTEELLKEITDLWKTTDAELGRSPRIEDLGKYGIPFSACIVARRFGSWRNALLAVAEVLNPGASAGAQPGNRIRREVSSRTRFLIFKRDLYRCCLCRRSGVELELDHIIPLSKGGSNSIENLQTLCVPCNRGKSGNLQ